MALLLKLTLNVHHPNGNDVNAPCASRMGPVSSGRLCANTVAEALALPDDCSCVLVPGCGLAHTPLLQLLAPPVGYPGASLPAVVSIVIMRAPVARQLSGFFHGYPHSQRSCSDGRGGRHGHCETLEHHFSMPRYDNVMTRMLGQGVYPYAGTDDLNGDATGGAVEHHQQPRRLGELGPSRASSASVSTADLALAVARLRSFAVVALNEAFVTAGVLTVAAATGKPPGTFRAAEAVLRAATTGAPCDGPRTGARGWETKMCRVGSRRDSKAEYARWKAILKEDDSGGSGGSGGNGSARVVAAARRSNALDRHLYAAAKVEHCARLEEAAVGPAGRAAGHAGGGYKDGGYGRAVKRSGMGGGALALDPGVRGELSKAGLCGDLLARTAEKAALYNAKATAETTAVVRPPRRL